MGDAPRQPSSSSFRQRQSQQQQQQQQQPLQRQRRQFLRPPGLSQANPTPSRQARLRASVETLVRKLSRQNLQTSDAASVQRRAMPSPSVSPNIAAVPDRSLPQGSPSPKPNNSPSRSPLAPLERSNLSAAQRPLTPGSPIEVDESIGPAQSSDRESRFCRPFCYRTIPNAMDLDQGEELEFGFTSLRLPEPIAPVPAEKETMFPPGVLEVDEAYLGEPSTMDDRDLEDEATLIEKYRAMRRTATPGGTMRRNVDGVPLRFRSSADVALRCQNLVLSKPRMRRRKRRSPPDDNKDGRRDSMASSTMTEASAAPAATNSHIHSHL